MKVDTVNITSQVYSIRNGNNGSDILVRDKNYRMSNDNDFTYCCNYEFFVLNAKCKSVVSTTSLFDLCKITHHSMIIIIYLSKKPFYCAKINGHK